MRCLLFSAADLPSLQVTMDTETALRRHGVDRLYRSPRTRRRRQAWLLTAWLLTARRGAAGQGQQISVTAPHRNAPRQYQHL